MCGLREAAAASSISSMGAIRQELLGMSSVLFVKRFRQDASLPPPFGLNMHHVLQRMLGMQMK